MSSELIIYKHGKLVLSVREDNYLHIIDLHAMKVKEFTFNDAENRIQYECHIG